MLTINRNVLRLCSSRRQILQCLVSNIWRLDQESIYSCSVLKFKKHKDLSLLVTPVEVKHDSESSLAGKELTGSLHKPSLLKIINAFYRSPSFKNLAKENGIDDYLLSTGFFSFRNYCLSNNAISADLHIVLSDLIKGHGNTMDIFPYFLQFIKEMYPHLNYLEDLKKIGDLRFPANWYAEARKMKRKITYHCGPTNSGKTHQALQSFLKSSSGIYCGPLKLLAVEVYDKTNELGTPCDLLTGEDIIFVNQNGDPSSHLSCTIEMVSLDKEYDVAIIDEVQMIKDEQRGWAWTRALLGLRAKEIHICGEEAAVDIIDSILCTMDEEMEVKKYSRLTKLSVVSPLKSLQNVQPGDCIVCFNKNDIFTLSQELEKLNVECALIYGSLPPGAKIKQCKKFNDPNSTCKVLVATDAIGMGLNLTIKRIIFYSAIKPSKKASGSVEFGTISVSQALQIAGRAGRFGTRFSEGFVTTFYEKDLDALKLLLSKSPETVLAAGLLPTVDQIEMFSYYLPNSPLKNLIEIFMNLSTVDDSVYFLCDMSNFLFLAERIEHIPLPIRTKFVLCFSPIDTKLQFPVTMLVKFAKLLSENQAITATWLNNNIHFPFEKAEDLGTLSDLMKLEEIYDVIDLYLWLGNRYPQYFPDLILVKSMQQKIDNLILECIANRSKLTNFSENDLAKALIRKGKTSKMNLKLILDKNKTKNQESM